MPRHSGDQRISEQEAHLLNDLYNRFEAAWRASLVDEHSAPAIEDSLALCPELLRPLLFSELLTREWKIRTQAGEDLSEEAYRKRFPNYQAELAQVLSKVHPVFDSTENGGSTPTISMNLEKPQLPTGEAKKSHPCPPLQRIGEYEVLRVLGEGTFGCVYEAKDVALDRKVAIKIPHLPSEGASERTSALLEQFQAEARKVAKLEHEGIVPVYNFGLTEDGRPYIVSRLIPSGDLAARLNSGKLDFETIAEITEQIASALHKAHLSGLVHRDIKPQNLLLDDQGRPFIADFGLALFSEDRRRHRGRVAGSPAYMSPEQARGETHHIDGRSDIWSLGVVLYEMLTGIRPFAGSVPELLQAIPSDLVKPPRQIDDSIPAELERIALKCLKKNPADRYSTAKDLARDLRRWRGAAWPRSQRMILATALGMLACIGLWLCFRQGLDRPVASPSARAAVSEPLRGTLTIRKVAAGGEATTPHVETDRDMGMPFRVAGGETIQFEAEVNRPAFLYVLWIDSEGQVLPLHPWGLKWDRPLPVESRKSKVVSPGGSQGWEFGGPPGVETLVLLAREEPLPDDLDLQHTLAKFPIIELPQAFRERGPKSSIPREMPTVDDRPRRRMLETKLQTQFPLIQIKSFLNLGELPPQG